MPSVGTPRSASATTWRPGPQPMSSAGPRTRSSARCSAGPAGRNHRSAGAASTVPRSSRSWARPTGMVVVMPRDRRLGGPPPADRPPPRRAANGLSGIARATTIASAMVSTSTALPTRRVRSPRARRRASCAHPVAGVLIGTPANAGTCGSRRPTVHQPPSAVRPRVASTPGASRASRVARTSPGVTWGVSMPRSSVGPDAPAKAAPRRSASVPRLCGTTGIPGGNHGPGRPSRTSTGWTPGVLRAVSSVAVSAARGDRRGLVGRARRAEARLDPAGPGLLGDDEQRRAGHRSTAVMSRTVRAVPRRVPVTLERPTRGA